MIQPHIRSLRTQPGSWGAHPQPPLADAIPHFDMPSHNSAAKPGAGAGGGGGKGGGGFPDEDRGERGGRADKVRRRKRRNGGVVEHVNAIC